LPVRKDTPKTDSGSSSITAQMEEKRFLIFTYIS